MMNCNALLPGALGWPVALDELHPSERPKQLFIAGDPVPDHEQCIGIVGTREATVTGLEIARSFARAFAQAGYVIVSGLARGIDAAAHRAALEVGGGTIAVLGCGLDVFFPPRNANLQRQIAAHGTLLSEYQPGTEPHGFHFPRRNRLIAGLSRGVVVIEGGLKSGALITARWSADLGRDVWAVPGSPRSAGGEGPNHLIRTGNAGLVTAPDHVFEEIAPAIAWEQPYNVFEKGPVMTEEERGVLAALDDIPRSADEVCMATQRPAGRMMLLLATLEVKGLAVRARSGGFCISEAGVRALSVAREQGGGAARAAGAP